MTGAKTYPEVPELVSIADMPEIFGLKSRQWIDQMRTNGVFLEPDGYVGRTPYWIRERIVDWWPTRSGARK